MIIVKSSHMGTFIGRHRRCFEDKEFSLGELMDFFVGTLGSRAKILVAEMILSCVSFLSA